MELEEDSSQERLLQAYDSSPIGAQVSYKLLLNALRSKDFRTFRNTVEHGLKEQPPVLNLNHVFRDQSEETCLDIASRDGSTEFVEFLLRKGAQPNRVNMMHNRAPVHFATEGGHVYTLAKLLAEPTINPNLEAGQQTALHIAVRKKNLACASLLLERGASASIPNSKGLTALHLAAMKEQRDMVELILEKCRQSPDLDSYKDYNGETTRQVIQQMLPGISLPPKRETREVNEHDLKYYLIANDEANFLKCLETVRPEVLRGTVENLLEIAARSDFREATVGMLSKLREGTFSVKRAARVAIKQSHYNILRELLNAEPDAASDLLLDACQELGMPEKRADSMPDRLECLKLILEQENVDVHCTDNKSNTPLHYAARAGCREAVTLLLERGSYIGHTNKFNVPPIADIPANILSHYFDDCLRTQKKRTNEYMIEFDYHCLMPYGANAERSGDQACRPVREMKVLQHIAHNNSLKHLLKHPLLSSFLYLKWRRIRYILYANFAFYVMFYLLLNAYILTMTRRSTPSMNSTATINDSSDVVSKDIVLVTWYGENYLWAATAVVFLLFICREVLQLVSCPWRYATNSENWLEATLIALTAVVLCDVGGPPFGAATILLSAWELVILISQHPRMSTGIEMFRTVSFNFMRFLFPYAFLILAFALAFFTLFKGAVDADNFFDPGHSLFKTVIMLTGEFEAGEIPFVSYPIWSHVVFVLFVFFIAIVLFNLLNGLAVSDTAEILRKAELVGLISRIRLITYIEDIAIGEPFVRWCCCDISRRSQWNPFAFLARKILLFPDCLRDGKISVKLYDSLDCDNDRCYEKYVYNEPVDSDKRRAIIRMDPSIIKQAKRIICDKKQVSENENVMIALGELRAIMNDILNKLTTKNNNDIP